MLDLWHVQVIELTYLPTYLLNYFMITCMCDDISEHKISCPNHPRNKQEIEEMMNAYHVLAKITGLNVAEQRHFFVKAACASDAISLAELRVDLPSPDCEDFDVQYTVKEAKNRGSSGMNPHEEIYSL